MDAKHQKGGSLELRLSHDEFIRVTAGNTVETNIPTESGLLAYVMGNPHRGVEQAVAELYASQIGIYVPAREFSTDAIRLAIDSKKPITVVPRDNIHTMADSPNKVSDLFGADSTISILPQQAG